MSPQFLYITEVFCPWCWGFVPTIHRLQKEYGFPIRVLCGCLNESRLSMRELAQKMPNARAFFQRLTETTGRNIGDAYFNLLYGPQSDTVFMDSVQAGTLFYSLKHCSSHPELEIMETLEHYVYGLGQDIFHPGNIQKLIAKFEINPDLFALHYADKNIAAQAAEEVEEGLGIMGDIILYPTLYLVNGNEKILAARGYTPIEQVRENINSIIAGNFQNTLAAPSENGNPTSENSACCEGGACRI